MKFVNKLSVIGLIVLMFSFMNILQADDGDGGALAPKCSGTSVSICANSKTQSKCEGTYRYQDGGKSQQCKWDASTSVCRANGNYCQAYY
jgi:hypothetical protein